MSKYEIPKEYYFRIHHVRPRFKDEYENVLLFLASEIAYLPEMEKDEFDTKFDEIIRKYGKNPNSSDKTIANWRTEMSALFGLLEYNNGKVRASKRTKELAENQDVIEFFKKFLFTFQYPGAHIKQQEVLKQIEKGVNFKPAQYILSVLNYAENKSGKREYITKSEACHCIFNDLRCTRDHESPSKVWNRILKNRKDGLEYDERGDVIRYAGDILSYMEIANLLVCYDYKHFYINKKKEKKMIDIFIKSPVSFDGYKELYIETQNRMQKKPLEKLSLYYKAIREQYGNWYSFVNQDFDLIDFSTNIDAVLEIGSEEYIKAKKDAINKIFKELQVKDIVTTKTIGDGGENVAYYYEFQRVAEKRRDIVRFIRPIPTKYYVGFDLQSVEIDEPVSYKKRYIEVKTTKTCHKLSMKNNRVHLTPNEISTAETVMEHYYVYRFVVSKTVKKVYIIKNPIQLFYDGKISIEKREDGADLIFDHNDPTVCSCEDLKI